MPLDRDAILSKLSVYTMQILDDVESNITLEFETELKTLKSEISSLQAEINTLFLKCGQAEDTVKFQKRTILSLKSELEGGVRNQETVPVPVQAPIQQPHVDEAEPEPEHVEQSVTDEPPVEGPELIPIVLLSGTYFWHQETGDLYDFISEDEAGDVCGLIKSVKIKKQIYYLDTSDNKFYKHDDDDNIGLHMGQIINGKAIFN